jgi:hypothetical protein
MIGHDHHEHGAHPAHLKHRYESLYSVTVGLFNDRISVTHMRRTSQALSTCEHKVCQCQNELAQTVLLTPCRGR